jgi:hypothetical protein
VLGEKDDIGISPLDSERFGIRIARVSDIEVDALPRILAYCESNAVTLLVARCRIEQVHSAQAMEEHGFRIMDTMLHYALDVSAAKRLADSADVVVREIRPGEAEDVAAIAEDTFGAYLGHYHADERLDPYDCKAVYVSWASRSCTNRDVADLVLVAETDTSLAGFLTMKRVDETSASLPLAGVACRFQGRHVHSTLHNAMVWRCAADGLKVLHGSTQASNLAMQKNMLRAGWLPTYGEFTFHKWFD